jgi:hypothetical protein
MGHSLNQQRDYIKHDWEKSEKGLS